MTVLERYQAKFVALTPDQTSQFYPDIHQWPDFQIQGRYGSYHAYEKRDPPAFGK